MALRIEDYALIGDTHTVALVGTNGSIDWLCLPRFDAPACFASLLGTGENGFWQIAPRDEVVGIRRRYRGPTLVLETEVETAQGAARLVDCMPPRGSHPRIVRVVEGVRGEVAMRMRFTPRFDYGRVRPWVSRVDGAVCAIAGPDALELRGDVSSRRGRPGADRRVHRRAGTAGGFPAHLPSLVGGAAGSQRAGRDDRRDRGVVARVVGRSTYRGRWAEPVERSLITLKALTYEPTGGIVAAADDVAARSSSAGSATGTTAIAGCGTRPSRSTRSCRPATWRRRSSGVTGRCARWPAIPRTSRSCTVSAESGGSTSTSSLAARATSNRGPCGSATPRPVSGSWTCTARSSTRCSGPAGSA